ncbi:MAG: hypothetical protein Q4A05_06670, partial [Ruminococcus sp.]|nr:hypothetical protein [Ruminococcus sp.]
MKKTSAILLAGALLLTGCGSKGVSQSSSESAGTSEVTAPTERNDDVVITLGAASWGGLYEMGEFIDRFNAEDNGVRVEVRNFTELEEFRDFGYDEHGVFQGYSDEESKQMDFFIAQELINKDTIDIVVPFTFCDNAKYEIFKRKGGFVDLYRFMENDPEVSRDTLNTHILGLCEYDGKLYSIPTYYMVNTMIG